MELQQKIKFAGDKISWSAKKVMIILPLID